MVGGPRSKGCRICIQRKVKCDQTRPTCNNCKKRNRPCPGYEDGLKIFDEGQKLRQKFEPNAPPLPIYTNEDYPAPAIAPTSATSRPLTHQFREPVNWIPMTETIDGAVKAANFLVEPLFDPPHEARARPPSPFYASRSTVTQLRQDLFSPKIFQDQLFALFTQSMAPPNSIDIPKRMLYYGTWLSAIPDVSGEHALLDNSVRAIGLVHLGRMQKSDDILHDSRIYYIKALRLLNTTILSSHEDAMTGETLSATVLLSFYEMLASQSECWIRHAGGTSTLMRVRGPRAHREGLAREVFMASRFHIIIQAFQTGSYCFLDSYEWDDLNSQIRADIRASNILPRDRVQIFDWVEDYYDCMVRIPAIVHEAQNVTKVWREKGFINLKSFIAHLTLRARDCRKSFKNIFVRLQRMLTTTGMPVTNVATGDPIFPIRYQFPNMFFGSTITGYWTVAILLNSVLSGLEEKADLDAYTKENLDLYKTESRDIAINICRSVPYMISSSFLGPFFVVFALRMSLNVFPKESNEFQWVVQRLHEISQKHLPMAAHLPGWNGEKYMFHSTDKPHLAGQIRPAGEGTSRVEIVKKRDDGNGSPSA